jgi:hypothetical protein
MLVPELRTVLHAGLTVARLEAVPPRVPHLLALVPTDGVTSLEQAISIREAIVAAANDLGDGPVGRAAAALFGSRSSSRGLRLPARRREAAFELDIEPATLVRHREAEILLELAVALCLRYG